LTFNGKTRDTFIVGKRKPFLDSVQDQARVKKYTEQFDNMYVWFLEDRNSLPEDYKKASW